MIMIIIMTIIIIIIINNNNIIIFTPLRVFHTSVNWWSFTGVWVTASLLKCPRVSRTLLSILPNLNSLDGLHLPSYFQVFQSLY